VLPPLAFQAKRLAFILALKALLKKLSGSTGGQYFRKGHMIDVLLFIYLK
jgi:hypothetical protein